MPTKPRDAAWHYATAERLLDATPETPETGALLALAHANLATVDPRKLRRRKDATLLPPATGDSPRQRWLRGDDR
jgi:hypothetical protein